MTNYGQPAQATRDMLFGNVRIETVFGGSLIGFVEWVDTLGIAVRLFEEAEAGTERVAFVPWQNVCVVTRLTKANER